MHRIIISMRTLKRITKRCGLYRHKYHSDILQVVAFIASHCESYGQMHGYRWMHYKCLKNSLVVSQETLRTVMHILDPEGIANRKAHKLQRRKYVNPGPNFVWHYLAQGLPYQSKSSNYCFYSSLLSVFTACTC